MAVITPRVSSSAIISANYLKYVLFAFDDPLAEVEPHIFGPGPHPARTVSFVGIELKNYTFKLIEQTAGGVFIKIRDQWDFDPDRSDIEYKVPEDIKVDLTPGLVDGATTATFDGTAGKPNWIGWEPIINKQGFGVLVKGEHYLFDSTSGLWTLIIDMDQFYHDQEYHVEFVLVINGTQSVPAAKQFSEVLQIFNDTALTPGDIGKKWLVQGEVSHVVNTLPQLATVVRNKVTFVEAGIGQHKCCEFTCYAGDKIDFGKGARDAIRIGVCESFELYKGKDADGNDVWRVSAPVGNFLSVGRHFFSFSAEAQEFNSLPFDGRSVSSLDYARLYNDHVLLLDPLDTVTFAAWPGSDKTKFSQADPTTGNFYLPDLRGLIEKPTPAAGRRVATKENDAVGDHYHLMFGPNNGGDTDPTNNTFVANEHSWSSTLSYKVSKSTANPTVGKTGGASNGAAETLVKNVSANLFVLT